MINALHKYRILIADADRQLGQVFCDMLAKMGFTNTEFTRSGKQALELLQSKPFDFLITEWNTQEMNGLQLIDEIRHNPHSRTPTLPILMLTGRAEQPDVVTARDHGINEYVVKPFSAKAIYSRIERLVEQPRPFVVSKSFIGPDRRHHGAPPSGVSERRSARIAPQLAPKLITGKNIAKDDVKLWLPDFSLKLKLGGNISLQSLITPAVLDQAQAAVNAITSESLNWVKSDLQELKMLYQTLISDTHPATLSHDLCAVALSINSRAGTFGYTRAAQIAYMLYLFCRNSLQPTHKNHPIVVQKHIDVLHIIFGNQIRGDGGTMGVQIYTELKHLIEKYSA